MRFVMIGCRANNGVFLLLISTAYACLCVAAECEFNRLLIIKYEDVFLMGLVKLISLCCSSFCFYCGLFHLFVVFACFMICPFI